MRESFVSLFSNVIYESIYKCIYLLLINIDSDESSSESSDSAQSTISSTTDSALSELIEALKYTNLVAKNLIQLFKFSSHDLLNFSLSNAKLYDDEIFAGAPKYHLLKEYQKRSVSWLLSLNSLGLGCILADEMGLVCVNYI